MKQFIFTVTLLTFAALLWPTPSLAHGGGTARLTNVEAGPYRLYVWSSPATPRVGETHVTVGVMQVRADGSERPATANVVVTLTSDAASSPIVREAVRGSSAADVYYEADIDVPTAGTWQVTVRAEGEAGTGEASYRQQVLPARGVNWWLVAGVAAVLLLVVGLSRITGRRETPAAVGGAV